MFCTRLCHKHSETAGGSAASESAEAQEHRHEKLRSALQHQYTFDYHEPRGTLGEGWRAFSKLDNRPVVVRVVRDPRRCGLPQIRHAMECDHPAVIVPRDVFDCAGIGTVFVFSAVDEQSCTLHTLLHDMTSDVTEAMVGALFTPVVLGMHHFASQNMLPPFALIDTRSALVYPNGAVKVVNPVLNVHNEGDSHYHHKLDVQQHKLEYKGSKLEKKWSAARDRVDADAVQLDMNGTPVDASLQFSRGTLSDRYLIADLGMVLYEIMTRKHAHKISTVMIAEAKKMRKASEAKPASGYSADLTQLLVDLLENGKSEKHRLITLQALLQRSIMRRFVDQLLRDVRRSDKMSAGEKEQYNRVVREQLAAIAAPTAASPRGSATAASPAAPVDTADPVDKAKGNEAGPPPCEELVPMVAAASPSSDELPRVPPPTPTDETQIVTGPFDFNALATALEKLPAGTTSRGHEQPRVAAVPHGSRDSEAVGKRLASAEHVHEFRVNRETAVG